jgi:anti-sigma factor RsiW
MTSEQARAVFDAAVDGELEEPLRDEFEAALAGDEALRADFERHRALFGARAKAREDWSAVPSVDLLAGVQHKLRARSGGRFYRDRFAEQRHLRGLGVMSVLSAAFLIAVALWFVYQSGAFDAR